MTEPIPSPDASVQPDKAPEPVVQAEKAGAPSALLSQITFLARMRRLLDMHNDLFFNKPNSTMWAVGQIAGLVLGVTLAWSAYQELLTAQYDQGLAVGAAILFIAVGAILPTMLLKLAHRTQSNAARDRMVDFIEMTLRNYPSEVDQCGGVAVLADRVQVESLIHLLQEKLSPPKESPLPPPSKP